ncbi:DUF3052 domain-containing protein [Devosia sp. XK-2]|uniref:DUF3052 domain-containing protein n=1 Tax=Devosia sp. XK-2 TaxID=3126689 RepID=UPI0030D223D5
MSDAGYSGTPLAQKLGLKDGGRVLFVDLPRALSELTVARDFAQLGDIALDGLGAEKGPFDFIHLFTTSRAVLENVVERLKALIVPDGMIWVSWPKKAAKVATDVTEDVIRDAALPRGLVDVKVCAVDQTWSGLKLVIRKELR